MAGERESLGTIGVDVEPQTRTQIEGLADSLTRLGDRVKSAAATLDTARAKVTDFGAGVYRAGSDLVGYATRLGAAAEAVSRLSAEQEALDRNSARLGLDFDAAATAAGRFVDETETMGTATRFAEAGVRLTQQELEALSRVAGAFSQNTGQSTAAVFQQLADGTLNGTEALRRFGPELAALQGPAHSVEERLAAMVHHAEQVPRAVDSAADSVARYRDQLEDSERAAAAAFTAEMGRLSQLSQARAEAMHGLDDTAVLVRNLGREAADAVSFVGNGVVAAMTGVAIGINGVVSIGRAVIQGLPGLENALGGRAAARADTAQANTLQRLMAARIAAMRDAWNGAPGTTAAPAGVGGGDQGMVGSGAESDVIEVQGTRAGGGGGAGSRGMTGAARQRAAEAAQAAYQQQLADEAKARQSAAEAANDNNYDRRDRVRAAAEEANRAFEQRDAEQKALQATREAALLENRADHYRSFTDEFEALHQRQVNAAQESAAGITDALGALGSAYGDAIMAFVTGEATIGEALQGMLSKTLSTIGKEASVKAGFQLAEGLAALFLNPAEAGAHFAAAAAYTGVAATAGALGDVTAVEKSKPSAAGGGSRAAAESLGGTRGGSSRDAPAPVTNNYYAPLVGGRESTDAEAGTRLRRYDRAADVRLTRPRAA